MLYWLSRMTSGTIRCGPWKNVRKELSARGVEFTEGFVTTLFVAHQGQASLQDNTAIIPVIRNAPPYGELKVLKRAKRR